MIEVFLDTSFAIALSAVTDQNHLRALELANELERKGTRLVSYEVLKSAEKQRETKLKQIELEL